MPDGLPRAVPVPRVPDPAPSQRAFLEAQPSAIAPVIPCSGIQEVAPLSFSQQRLWFLDQLEPGSAKYNVPRRIELSGELDVAALHKALEIIVARHEVLRTRFAVVDGSPVQVILPALAIPLPVTDLGTMAAAARDREASRLASEEARRPFHLEQGPLFRARLLRLGEREHILLLNTHHIVYDGWSAGVLFRELGSLYRALLAGEPATLPGLPLQYAGYALWQRKRLQGDFLDRQLEYWRAQLQGAPAVLELYGPRARRAAGDSPGARYPLTLSGPLTDALKSLSLGERATLFMTLLAAFQSLLARYTQQFDIVVGTPIANRTRTELEGLIGFFVNTLALRTDLSGDPPFRELLRRVREVALGAYTHQEVPFERVVEDLQPERNLGQTPLFQVMLVLQNTPRVELRLPGLTLRHVGGDTETAKFDLSLTLVEDAGALRGAFIYNRDLFDGAAIARLAGHFQVLLESIVADPGARISMLPLLTRPEREQLLVGWNATARDFPEGRCIHELFEAQVARTPDAVAVISGQETLTYDALNRRANRLAHHLRGLGVARDVLVGLCLERSVNLIVGMLGILKAGGAYVPLDPTHPPQRLGFLLADSGVRTLVTEEGIAAELPVDPAQLVCLDAGSNPVARDDSEAPEEENPAGTAGASHLAYVLYTSGSTGRPKGVMVEHRSVVNYLSWVDHHLLGDAVRTVPLITSLTFDASLKQAIAPLLRGSAVWILPRDVAAQPAALLRALETRRGVGLNCVPSLWAAVLDALEAGGASSSASGLTCLLLGGEPLTDELVHRTFLALPHARLWNLYGPTETTANASAAPIAAGDQVSIGCPVANTQLYVLDRHLQPVPVGVAGELHIGGSGIARGYLGRPGLTAEKFIPDPFGPLPGARLYRTGDQVRRREEGEIEFLGRLDHQVKLRGYRIELGEIEGALARLAGVRCCAVLLREDAPGERRLVAYVVPSGEEPAVRASEWREHLKRQLPDYMVPSAFVVLESLPLSPSGKVNRQALPAPENGPGLEDGFLAPRTATEQLLAGIWAAVLRLERVDVRDNFFALGGHSLLATQVVSRVLETLEVELPLRTLFEVPTIAELAERIDHARRLPADPVAPPPLARIPLARIPRQRG